MEPVDARALPPRPVMTFQVGVTGHRALPDADIDALKAAAAGQFRAIREEVMRLQASDQASATPLYRSSPPELRCICGLAEGADFIFAEAALSEGWQLVAALPFAREEFEKDFKAEPVRERFRTLLGKAATVSELDGDRHRGGEPYAHVGEQIVEQSDLLLVVWDGLPPRGPGGTGDVVQRALESGLPVAVLPRNGPVAVVWYGKRADGIPALLKSTLLPAADATGFPAAYFRELPRNAGLAASTVRCFERAMLTGLRLKAPERAAAATAGPGIPGTDRVVEPAEARLLPYFIAADQRADEYAMRYRVAGLMRFGLIVPATLGGLLASFGGTWMRVAGMLLQFAALVSVVAFTNLGGWERSQRRFVGYRALAEYLRTVRLLAPLRAVPRPPARAVHQARAVDWTTWYVRAVVRCVGLIPGRLDAAAVAAAAAFLRAQTVEQLDYLQGCAARYSALAGRLRRIGMALLISGIAFETARGVFQLTGTGGPPVLWLNDLSIILPGLAPVFLGLLAFGEYSRLATRYQAVATELESQLAALDRAEPGRRAGILIVGRRIADVMLAESDDWQLLIRAGSLSAY